jgi:hypothetical protein
MVQMLESYSLNQSKNVTNDMKLRSINNIAPVMLEIYRYFDDAIIGVESVDK